MDAETKKKKLQEEHNLPMTIKLEKEMKDICNLISGIREEVFHDGEYKENDIDIEFCEAVPKRGKDTETIKFKKIDKIDTAACVMHKGPYSTLGEAYSAVYKWIEENNYIPCDNPRESYIDGIWNKEEWLTEIQVPIVSKNNL